MIVEVKINARIIYIDFPERQKKELKYVITKTCKWIIRIINIIYAWIMNRAS